MPLHYVTCVTSPPPDCVYAAPDGDIPLAACGLSSVPVLMPLDAALAQSKPLVYLEAHRAPAALLAKMTAHHRHHITLVGDPDALGHRDGAMTAALARATSATSASDFHLEMASSVEEALAGAKGLVRILVADAQSSEMVYAHLRPDGHCPGDRVYDFEHQCLAYVRAVHHGHLELDVNGLTVHPDRVWQRLVETPARWGSGECDTLIVMPDVSATMGFRASRRVRYKLVSIGLAPEIFSTKPVV